MQAAKITYPIFVAKLSDQQLIIYYGISNSKPYPQIKFSLYRSSLKPHGFICL